MPPPFAGLPPVLGTAAGADVAVGDAAVLPEGAAVGTGVGVGVGAACTVIRPRMSVGWNLQMYSKAPWELKVCEKLLPVRRLPESNPPAGGQVENVSSHSVTVWKPATLFQVTVSPAVTVVSQTPCCETSQKYRFPTSIDTVAARAGSRPPDTSIPTLAKAMTIGSRSKARRIFTSG